MKYYKKEMRRFVRLRTNHSGMEMNMAKRKAIISTGECVACGCCMKVCPRSAILIPRGIHAHIDRDLCVGCGKCAEECPAGIITLEVTEQ